RNPLCPPLPPLVRNRICPSGKSASSTTTNNSATGTFSQLTSALTASPLRFMYVCGFASTILPAPPTTSPTSAENRDLFRKEHPSFSATLASTSNPPLWRVPSYSLLGLPSPTTNFGLADIYHVPRGR